VNNYEKPLVNAVHLLSVYYDGWYSFTNTNNKRTIILNIKEINRKFPVIFNIKKRVLCGLYYEYLFGLYHIFFRYFFLWFVFLFRCLLVIIQKVLNYGNSCFIERIQRKNIMRYKKKNCYLLILFYSI
jgi:hypothetical protein